MNNQFLPDTHHLPYIPEDEFNERVLEYAKTNFVLKNTLGQGKIKTWQDLPPHLIAQLFVKLGSKPDIKKY